MDMDDGRVGAGKPLAADLVISDDLVDRRGVQGAGVEWWFAFTAFEFFLDAVDEVLVVDGVLMLVPAVQARVMDKAADAPALASAANIAAFNLGNAIAAWISGSAIDAGLGYTAPTWIGALLAGAAILGAAISGTLDRRTRLQHDSGHRGSAV
ncbi:hypothetical protein [Actinomadura napierensis]|uniref:MFS transporter n=1 Tax=Actinomadura napierensis TaxID=267854 RepID=A0ABP5JZC9_9ACTN